MKITQRLTFSMHSSGMVGLEFRPGAGLWLSHAQLWDTRHDDEVAEIKVWATDGSVRFKMRSGKCLGSASLSPDGKLVAAGTDGGRVRVYEVGPPRTLRKTLVAPDLIASPLFAPDGHTLAVGGSFGGVDIFAVDALARVRALKTDAVGTLAFSADGTFLAVGEQFGVVHVFDLTTGAGRILGNHDGHVYASAFSPDGKTLITASVDWVVKEWELSGGRMTASATVEPRVLCLGFLPDGCLITGDSAGRVHIRKSLTGTVLAEVELGAETHALAVSPTEPWFATGDALGKVTCWEIA